MMIRRIFSLFSIAIAALACGSAVLAQSATDAERTYLELRRSTDRATQLAAERWYGLIRQQEWTDNTGQFSVQAKYLEHAPDLSWVKLRAVRGRGDERVERDITVPTERLNRQCQSRVRQISVLQERLVGLAAAEAERVAERAGGDTAGRGEMMEDGRGGFADDAFGQPMDRDPRLGPMDADARMGDEAAGRDARAIVTTDPGPVLNLGDPSLAGPPRLILPTETFSTGAAQPRLDRDLGGPPAADPSEWRTSYDAFLANVTVVMSELEGPQIDWGGLEELRAAAAMAAGSPLYRLSDQEVAESQAAIAATLERMGQVSWEAPLQNVHPQREGTIIEFDLRALPEPLQLTFVLDDHSDINHWVQLPIGEPVQFVGHFEIESPYRLRLRIRLADEPTPR